MQLYLASVIRSLHSLLLPLRPSLTLLGVLLHRCRGFVVTGFVLAGTGRVLSAQCIKQPQPAITAAAKANGSVAGLWQSLLPGDEPPAAHTAAVRAKKKVDGSVSHLSKLLTCKQYSARRIAVASLKL